MERTASVYLGPVVALMTLAIGVGFVRAAEAVVSLFEPAAVVSQEQPTEENIGVTSSENFKSFEPERTTRGRVLACYDTDILPIWHKVKEDKVFQDMLSEFHGVMNCSDMIEIFKTDLNGDEKYRELLVRGKHPYLCSNGNCGYWIFEEKESRFMRLLAATDYVEVVGLEYPVQRSKTLGYSDLVLKEHYGSETFYRTFKFDGRQYAESRCVFERPKYFREGEGSVEILNCSEVRRRKAF